MDSGETLTLMGRQPNRGASPSTHRTHCLTSPQSQRGTAHDETGVEAKVRSRRVEIPPQSQRHQGESVVARVETGVYSMKMIAMDAKLVEVEVVEVGRHIVAALFFEGVDVRTSTICEVMQQKKSNNNVDLVTSLIRSSGSHAKEVGDSAHVYAG
jgi:hypothetical protein